MVSAYSRRRLSSPADDEAVGDRLRPVACPSRRAGQVLCDPVRTIKSPGFWSRNRPRNCTPSLSEFFGNRSLENVPSNHEVRKAGRAGEPQLDFLEIQRKPVPMSEAEGDFKTPVGVANVQCGREPRQEDRTIPERPSPACRPGGGQDHLFARQSRGCSFRGHAGPLLIGAHDRTTARVLSGGSGRPAAWGPVRESQCPHTPRAHSNSITRP